MGRNKMHMPSFPPRNIVVIREKKRSLFIPGIFVGAGLVIAFKVKRDLADEQKREELKKHLEEIRKAAAEVRDVAKDKASEAREAASESLSKVSEELPKKVRGRK